MKTIVLMKQTFDTEAKIELNNENQISDDGIKLIMNPYDEFAVEEAVSIKETCGGEVTVISLGPDTAVDSLRQALAMGCDNAILLDDKLFSNGDEYSNAKVLAKAIGQMDYDLILSGWVSVDSGSGQVAVRVAELLNIPQVTVVTKTQLLDGKMFVDRETDSGTEKIEVMLPAMITVQKGINEPRYPNMRGIIQAKKKPIKRLTCNDLNMEKDEVGDLGSKTIVEQTFLPPKRQSCKMIQGDQPSDVAQNLVDLLCNEAKAI